jgi:23S rRNA (adenine2503-C2)-methyltransferase
MVLMGSGEPMMNYDEVMAFLHLMHEPYCKNFSYRNVALSTSGVVPGIYRLMEENLPITLSISLHAPNDTVRDKIMPVNKKWKIAEVVKAGKLYGEKTKRRVTYEYILIENVNDGEEHARELSHLLHGQLANVNLIPINPVTERALFRPSAERIQRFLDILTRQHISATIRKEMGTDIQAACGQLRNQYMKENDA